MRLVEISLKNVCQHEHTEVTFQPGVTGIFGPNGAGKSNLVKMAKACLTNDFKVNPGNKESNIRLGTGEKEESRIITIWEHEGTQFELKRGLQPICNHLIFPGENPIRNAREIETRLKESCGLSKQIVNEFIFVDQWRIFDFMSAKPQDRALSFMALCNTGMSEKVWEAIGDQIREDRSMAADFVDDSDERRASIKRWEARLAEANEKLVTAQSKLLKKSAGLANKQAIADYSRAKVLHEQRDQHRGKIRALQGMLDFAEKELHEAEKRYLDTARDVDDFKARADEAETALKGAEEYARRKADQDYWIKKRDQVKPEHPARPEKYVNIPKAEAKLAGLQQRLNEAHRVLGVLVDTGTMACPTCGTQVSELHDCLEEHQEVAKTYPGRLVQLRRRIDLSAKHDKTVTNYDAAIFEYKTETEAANKMLATLGKLVEPTADAVGLRRMVQQYQKVSREASAERTHVGTLKSNVNTNQAKLDSLKESIQEIDDKLESLLGVTEAKAKEAQRALDDHRRARAEIDQATETVTMAEEQIEQEKQAIKRIAKVKRQNKDANSWLEDLERWRSVVHRDALPNIVSQEMLEDMVERVNETLDEFGSPFKVSADDSLTFLAHKPDGTCEPAARLSGGEKVVLAIAFRFAINATFAKDIGMMVLDEPTAGLDEDNLDYLMEAMENVTRSARKRGQQLIIITHDRRLERVFDQVVELSREA